MAADIYRLFRSFISDETTDYTVTDFDALYFLDRAIDAMSETLDWRYKEDITITSTDITNGYVNLSYDAVTIISTTLGSYDDWNTIQPQPGAENIYWQFVGGKKISFIDTGFINEGTYTFEYRRRYKTFGGEVRENSYFDYPDNAELGIVLNVLALYQRTKGVIRADNVMNVINNKSEEGMSVSYGTMATLKLGDVDALKKEAIEIWKKSGNPANINFSVTV